MVNYIPKKGDIISINFDPTIGHEQHGKRPAIVISNYDFNKNTQMIICCPISTNQKEFPTHYILKNTKKIYGAVFLEHIRSFDYNARNISFIEKVKTEELEEITELLYECI